MNAFFNVPDSCIFNARFDTPAIASFQRIHDSGASRREINVIKISEREDETSDRKIGDFFVSAQKPDPLAPPCERRHSRQSNP